MPASPLQAYLYGPMEAGCDEAGRGPLAGPVVAAVVILPPDCYHAELTDSKKLSERVRDKLAAWVRQEAIAYGIGEASPAEIDQMNILQATFLAMHRALEGLLAAGVQPSHILVDGNRFLPYQAIPHTCIIKGDSLFASIAAASVLAKTTRDAQMRCLAEEHPVYHWEQNKGYPTPGHYRQLAAHGLSPHHRRSFLKGWGGELF